MFLKPSPGAPVLPLPAAAIVFAVLAGATLALCGASARAQTDYPSKPIRIVVPYPTGGFNDTLGRIVAAKLSTAWKQTVIVENKPGGGTVIGTQAVANAPADGYTLLVVQFPFAANPWLYKSLPYDSAKAFAPVVLAGRSPMLFVVPGSSPLRSMRDVLAQAKAKPGTLNYGSSGAGSSNHLAMALFESVTGTRMTQVPYKGSTPLLTDLAGGQVDLAIDLLPHALPFIQSGRLRPLAIAGTQRSPLMPDLPTTTEAGIPSYEVTSWHGLVAPAGTPPAVIDKLNRELNSIFAMDDVKKTFAQQGVVPDGGSPARFQQFIDAQMTLWKKVVQDAAITAE
ncbi:Bug family tripartite tricarboxylate transporter substrate binding protein [Pigmentiphaga litoralis]|uniref:Bug family tripartite tricarboxylate transporter substrate binding protein n=1 Tax=Pigmentiphaga litoralis TaxID=516702 RepID=UPI003B4351EB